MQDSRDGYCLEDSSNCLGNYGSQIEPFIVTRGRGACIYTSSGQEILDWTSGQVSVNPGRIAILCYLLDQLLTTL